MRLVNRYQVDMHDLEPFAEIIVLQSLWRKIQKLIVTVCCIVNCHLYFVLCHSRINGNRLDSTFLQICHLILHKCNQRSNDKAHPAICHAEHLKSYRLASACRHQSKRIFSLRDRLDNLLLRITKCIVSPIFQQYFTKLTHEQKRQR